MPSRSQAASARLRSATGSAYSSNQPRREVSPGPREAGECVRASSRRTSWPPASKLASLKTSSPRRRSRISMPRRSSSPRRSRRSGQHEGQQRRLRELAAVQPDGEPAVGDHGVRVGKGLARRHLREAEPLVERERGQHVRRVHADFVKAADHAALPAPRRRSTRRARQSTCAASSLSAGMYSKSAPPAARKVGRGRGSRSPRASRGSPPRSPGRRPRDGRRPRGELAQPLLRVGLEPARAARRATGTRPTSAPWGARGARRRVARSRGTARRKDRRQSALRSGMPWKENSR